MGQGEQRWRRRGGLAALFAGLLAGGDGCARDGIEPASGTSDALCTGGCCGEGGCECSGDSADVLLSPAQYASWVGGQGPLVDTTTGSSGGMVTEGPGTGDTGAGTSTGATDTGTSTGSTGMDTSTTMSTLEVSSSETGEGFDGAELTDSACVALCTYHADAYDWDLGCSFEGLTPEGQVHIVCTWTTGCEGRRHACLRSSGARSGGDALTSWLARAAHDEAGSVHAFVALGRELAAHGAPRWLLRRLRRAADDERRHARAVDRLVRARGGCWRRPVVRAGPGRDLLAIAVENAVEGCVRETWAALSAAHQARHAGDPRIRAAMVDIAADERRHAELAWALDDWLRLRLDDAAWSRVEAARADAARQLREGVTARRLPSEVVRDAGVPDGAGARALARGLAAALWPVRA